MKVPFYLKLPQSTKMICASFRKRRKSRSSWTLNFDKTSLRSMIKNYRNCNSPRKSWSWTKNLWREIQSRNSNQSTKRFLKFKLASKWPKLLKRNLFVLVSGVVSSKVSLMTTIHLMAMMRPSPFLEEIESTEKLSLLRRCPVSPEEPFLTHGVMIWTKTPYVTHSSGVL